MMCAMMKEDLLERLRRLDEDADLLYEDDRRFEMIVVGGSALILLDSISRATHDIDALNVPRELADLIEKYDINTQAETYINNFPYNFESRLRPIALKTRKINFYTASLEDIVIAKLYSYRDSDLADISAPEVVKRIDWELLRHLATAEDEAKASALNEFRYREFLDKYYDYETRCRPCDN